MENFVIYDLWFAIYDFFFSSAQSVFSVAIILIWKNKANFQKTKMNVSIYMKGDYEI